MQIEIKPIAQYARYWKINTINLPNNLESAAIYAAKKAIAFKKNMHNQEIYLTIQCINARYMQRLNKQYRKKDKPTNVLSFPADAMPEDIECPRVLGDIFLCNKVIESEANEMCKNFDEHFIHLVAHGTLHLLGYDHETEKDTLIMQDIEKKLLKNFNIANPYA